MFSSLSGDGGGCMLCIDADSFFLGVHRRADPTLDGSKPLVLWQHQDVICANPAAKALGVKKHMRPGQVRTRVEAAGGKLVHAYCRDWPGPRVWYEPYHAASREMFDVVRDVVGDGRPFERASIDECYVDVGGRRGGGGGDDGDDADPDETEDDDDDDDFEAAARLAVELRDAVEERTKLVVSIGIGPNKLVAKLAALVAKRRPSKIFRAETADDVDRLLGGTPAAKLPGLGTALGDYRGTALSLRTLPDADVVERYGADRLDLIKASCRGEDGSPVNDSPPSTVRVGSWTAHCAVRDLILSRHTGVGTTPGVRLPKSSSGSGRSEADPHWVFEPHPRGDGRKAKTNSTRPRWILLALALDLEARLRNDAALHGGRSPTKLTVSIVGPGDHPDPIPGMRYASGGTRSRSASFPRLETDGVSARDEEDVEFERLDRDSTKAARERCRMDCEKVDPTFLEKPTAQINTGLRQRTSAIVDAAAAILLSWVKDDPERQIAHLSLQAGSFERRSNTPQITTFFQPSASAADMVPSTAAPRTRLSSAARPRKRSKRGPLDVFVRKQSSAPTLSTVPANNARAATMSPSTARPDSVRTLAHMMNWPVDDARIGPALSRADGNLTAAAELLISES